MLYYPARDSSRRTIFRFRERRRLFLPGGLQEMMNYSRRRLQLLCPFSAAPADGNCDCRYFTKIGEALANDAAAFVNNLYALLNYFLIFVNAFCVNALGQFQPSHFCASLDNKLCSLAQTNFYYCSSDFRVKLN